MDIHPDDLDDEGNIKEYVTPVFEPFFERDFEIQSIDPQSLMEGGPGPSQDDGDVSVTAGWCPGGSWSGGICKPFNNNRTHWMSTYIGVRNLPIDMAILPGTHNAGFDKQAQWAPSLEVCQDVSPHDQLNAGIRVLDLRVQHFTGYPWGDPRRFSIFHSTVNGRTVQGDIIAGVKSFHYGVGWDRRREVVILDFHQFKGFTEAAHNELAGILKAQFGDRIISQVYKNLTISQIWALPNFKNVVIAYYATPRDEVFWPGVNQRWIGSNTPSDRELGAFISRVGNETKPTGEVRSIQAHRMSLPFDGAKDISGSLMSWFAAGSANHPIMKHFIIHTDWSLRHRLVDNIIYSNQFRARALGIPDVKLARPAEASIQSDARHLIFKISDEHAAETVALPRILDEQFHRLLICMESSREFELDMSGSDVRLTRVRLSKGDAVAFVCLDGNRQWKLQVRDYSPNEQGYLIPAPCDGEKFVRYTLSIGNYAPLICLPTLAPDTSVVVVVNKATSDTRISHHQKPGEPEHLISHGQSLAFTFNSASGLWEKQVAGSDVTAD
ncbi:hypothetical protein [Pseudomonas sp. NFX224]|uniref:hypothetical protein n=1 Tax=Pseudomonas sp. NFX224 TaxID=3402862 RepID=UPI003AFB720A